MFLFKIVLAFMDPHHFFKSVVDIYSTLLGILLFKSFRI